MRSWTHAEEEALRILAPLGCGALVEAFDRSADSINHKAGRLGVSLHRVTLRPTGWARQAQKTPRSIKSGRDTAVDVCSPTIKLVRELSLANLCPACAKRPIGVKRTGLCGPCHLGSLMAAHEQAIAKIGAQRKLWAARSEQRRQEIAKIDARRELWAVNRKLTRRRRASAEVNQ